MRPRIAWNSGTCMVVALASLFSFALFVLPLEAQVQCTGPDCANRTAAYERFLGDFESIYLSEAFQDIAAAHALANLSSLPGQGINLKNYALGAGLSAGFTSRREIPLRNADGTPILLPEMGISLTSGFHGGINLGWAVSFWYNLFKDGHCYLDADKGAKPCREHHTVVPVLSRLDLYVSGIRGFTSGNNPGLDSARDVYRSHTRVDSEGYGLRMHLMENRVLLSGLLNFSGLSLGMHVQKSSQGFGLNTRDILESRLGVPSAFAPDTGFEFTADSEMNTASLDLRVGFQLARFFHLGLSVGTARHAGRMRIRVARRLLEGERNILLEADRFHRVNFKMNHATLVVGVGGLYVQSTLGKRRGPDHARALSVFYVVHY